MPGLFGGQKNILRDLSIFLKQPISLCNLFVVFVWCQLLRKSTSAWIEGKSDILSASCLEESSVMSLCTSEKTLVGWGSLPNGMYIRFFLRRNGFMCSLWTLWTKISLDSSTACFFQWPLGRSEKNQTKWTCG